MDDISQIQEERNEHSEIILSSKNVDENLLKATGEAGPMNLDVDPFKHRLTMTNFEWMRTYILAVLLIPIRSVLISLTHLIAVLVSNAALYNLSEEQKTSKPIAPYWRKCAQQIVSFVGRTNCRFAGFCVTVKGELASAEEAPILLAAPHSGFFDAIVVWWSNTPHFVVAKENLKIPFLANALSYINQ